MKLSREIVWVATTVATLRLGVFLGVGNASVTSGGGLVANWNHWDSLVYATLAISGYSSVGQTPANFAFLSHFPPLYPLSMRLVGLLPGISIPAAGILVSFICIIIASCLLFKLMRIEFASKRSAWIAVVLLNLFPTAYFFNASYSEALFLCLSIGGFLLLRTNYVASAGLATGFSILARISGIAALPTLAAWFAIQAYKHKKLQIRLLLPLCIGLFGFMVYLIINKVAYGSPLYFMQEQISFGATKHLTIPFAETFHVLWKLPDWDVKNENFMMTEGWNALATIFAAIVIAVGKWSRIPWIYIFYGAVSVVYFASFSWGISNARYVVAIFPIFMILSRIKNNYVLAVLAILFLILQIHFASIFTTGRWAF